MTQTNQYRSHRGVGSIAWPLAAVASLGALVLALVAADRRLEPSSGLSARYLAGVGPEAALARETRDPAVTSRLVRARSASIHGTSLTVEWRGFLTAPRPGMYRLGAAASGAVEIYVDGRLLGPDASGPLSVAGPHAAEVALGARSHGILVRYETPGRPPSIELLMGPAGGDLEPVPPGLLSVVPRTPGMARLVRWRPALARGAALAWIASFAWLVLVAPVRALRRAWPAMRAASSGDRAFEAILVGAALLDLAGLWWGLPDRRGWAPDEIVPENILTGLRAWFSGGWHEIYPALPFALLGALTLPLAGLAAWLDWPLDGVAASTLIFVASRLVSVAASLGVVWMAYLAAAELAGRRAGRIAALLVALSPPAVYYAKVANVDAASLFWVAASLYFFIRVERDAGAADLLLFTSSATLSVCTKDQSYGFHVLPVVWLAWRHRSALVRWRTAPGACDALSGRAAAVAALTAAGLFTLGHNLVFNWAGFLRHLALITGEASQPYRMWTASLAGQAQMAAEALRQTAWILGWPTLAAGLAGLALLTRNGRLRLAWIALLPALSYYLFFIAKVGYLYDRFLLGPACLLAVAFAAGLGQPFIAGARGRRVIAAIALPVGLYLFARAASVDVMMAADSRYAAEDWLAANASEGQVTAGVGLPESLPRFSRRRYVRMRPHPAELARLAPDFVVFDARHLARYGADRPERALVDALASGRAGYLLASRIDRRPWWLPLAWERPFAGQTESPYTNLDKVAPRIDIYARGRTSGATPSR